jgi:outer membrane receptor protein involved in Fe transport
VLLVLACAGHASAQTTAAPAQAPSPSSSQSGTAAAPGDVAEPSSEATAPSVEVTAPRFITPLPGLMFDREQTTVNVQSATAGDIRATQAQTVTDLMNRTMQSVNVNDYQGNPFQQELTYRGFTASPQIGVAQGLSVYMDGIRINEPFGDIVNWDLIPMNAIRRMDLIPGSNPLFGLNTLGGALTINTKNGFTDPGADITVLGGSWNRRQAQVSLGGNNGTVGGFIAANYLDEDGWRENSPSSIRQLFANGTLRGRSTELGATFIYSDNTLVGNGTVPQELYRQQPSAVFTSPDQVENRVAHFALNGRVDLNDTNNISALIYQRQTHQSSSSGDFYDEWDQAANGRTGFCPPPFDATSTFPDGAAEVNGTGCPGVTPNGVFNFGLIDQTTRGGALQYNWATDKHQLVVGASYDSSDIAFQQNQMLGWIGPGGVVYMDPGDSAGTGLAALSQPIQRNTLDGTTRTASLFALGVLQVAPKLNLSLGARYNYTKVHNDLKSDAPIPLYQFTPALLAAAGNNCGAENGDPNARYFCSHGDFKYEAFNPYAGFSFLPTPSVNWFGSVSRGNRVPSPIELACARDHSADAQNANQNNGKLRGCSIPTAMTSDPFLPQVRSTSYETGLRGDFGAGKIGWNVSVYRTDLTDDIMFVSVGSHNRGVFDTFGQTRRQGAELGLNGRISRHTFSAAYSYIDATFQSSATVVNPANSSANHAQGQLSEFTISPGDRIPGVPQHMLRLGWAVDVTSRWNFGLSMIANSWSYTRGNENNQAQAGGTSSNGTDVVDRQGNTVVDPGRAYTGSGRIPGYVIFNLNTSFRVARDWSVFMRMDNVFDTSYVTAGDLGLNPFTPSRWGYRDAAGFNYNSNDWQYTNFVGPGSPRTVWIGVSYSFSPSATASASSSSTN